MTTRLSLKSIAAAWLVLGAITPSAYADPITVQIISGAFRYDLFNVARLQVQFPNGSADISWGDDNEEWFPDFVGISRCCSPGTRFSLSADESFSRDQSFPFFGGELRSGLEIYSVTSVNFSVVALRDITIPLLEELESRSFTIPFTFRGTLSGSSSNHRTLVLDLIGFGHASTTFTGFPPFEPFIGGASYAFEATPVPEPGTLLLLGSGLFALAARRSRYTKGRDHNQD